MENIQIKCKKAKEIYYDSESYWGVFAVELVEKEKENDIVYYNNYGNITIKGNVPKMENNLVYITNLKLVEDKKFGKGYVVEKIYLDQTNKQDSEAYLKAMLTEKQVEEIRKVYPTENIISLFENDNFDYRLVKGIGKVKYENIKDKLLMNRHLQGEFSELSDEYDLSFKMIKKLVSYYKNPSILLEKIKENPYILADDVKGIGFKKADEIALKKGIERNSYYRLIACLEYVLKENGKQGHTFQYKDKLIKSMTELLMINVLEVTKFINGLDQIENENFYVDEKRVALYIFYKNEKAISYDVQRIMNASKEINIPNFDEKLENIEIEQGFTFTDEQRKAIEDVLTHNLVLINGKAGTGKTSVIKGIVNMLKDCKEGFEYHTVALSGKASQRIKESTGLESSTIHRMLGSNKNNFNSFKFCRDYQLNFDLVVIDEASMINSNLFAKLLEAIESGTKVVITGDYSQLEPIGYGNVFYDLCLHSPASRNELTIVHRQALKSGILSCANKIREGIRPFPTNDFTKRKLGELKDLHYYPYDGQEKVLHKTLEIAKKYKQAGNDILKFQIITPLKNRGLTCTKELNNKLQDIFNPYKDQNTFKKGKIEFREGDKIIQNGNNYDKNVLNGTIGIILNIDNIEEVATILFEDFGVIEYSNREFNQVDLAYALSIHKTQGSQFENCVVVLDTTSFIMLSRHLLYTALTRAINQCFLVADIKALFTAIRTDKSSKRLTFLSEHLKL